MNLACDDGVEALADDLEAIAEVEFEIDGERNPRKSRRRLALASAHDDIVAQGVSRRTPKLEVTVVGAERAGEHKVLLLHCKRSGAA